MPLDPDAVKLVRTEGVQQDLAVVALWLKNLACTCHAPLPPPTPPSCQAVRGGLLLPQSMKPSASLVPPPPVRLRMAASSSQAELRISIGRAYLTNFELES